MIVRKSKDRCHYGYDIILDIAQWIRGERESLTNPLRWEGSKF